jgi:hypothetical protein
MQRMMKCDNEMHSRGIRRSYDRLDRLIELRAEDAGVERRRKCRNCDRLIEPPTEIDIFQRTTIPHGK